MGGALDLLEVHSMLLDQPQKMNESALSQSGRIGPPNYPEQRTGVYDDLHLKRERAAELAQGRRAPSQTKRGTLRFGHYNFLNSFMPGIRMYTHSTVACRILCKGIVGYLCSITSSSVH